LVHSMRNSKPTVKRCTFASQMYLSTRTYRQDRMSGVLGGLIIGSFTLTLGAIAKHTNIDGKRLKRNECQRGLHPGELGIPKCRIRAQRNRYLHISRGCSYGGLKIHVGPQVLNAEEPGTVTPPPA